MDVKLDIIGKIINYLTQTSTSFPFSKYTVYMIQISVNDKYWVIRRRYSEFFAIHSRLNLLYSNELPPFPEKKFFSMNQTTISERIVLLEIYINKALKLIGEKIYCKSFEYFADFIELKRMNTDYQIRKSSNSTRDSDESKKLYFTTSKGIECLLDPSIVNNYCPYVHNNEKEHSPSLIQNFLSMNQANKESISLNCKEFYTNFILNPRKFSDNEIFWLFFGNFQYPGLLHYIGRVSIIPVGSFSCIELVLKILNYELNPDCELYLLIFRSASFDKMMELDITSNLENKKFVAETFKILKLWANNEEIKNEIIQNALGQNIYSDYKNCNYSFN